MGKGLLLFCLAACLWAQQPQQPVSPAPTAPLKERPEAPANSIQVQAGTHILLSMINSVSTKQSVAGDRIYLETAFPIMADGKLIVPRGSWVTGTVTEVTRPKRGIGKDARGQLAVRFDSLTLPNGVSRSFGADLGALDAANSGTLDREHSSVKGPGKGATKEGVQTVLIATGTGAGVGTLAGAAAGHAIGGGLIGAAAGAGGGIIGILATRRPDAILERGTTVEMVLDRSLVYTADDVAGLTDGRSAAH